MTTSCACILHLSREARYVRYSPFRSINQENSLSPLVHLDVHDGCRYSIRLAGRFERSSIGKDGAGEHPQGEG